MFTSHFLSWDPELYKVVGVIVFIIVVIIIVIVLNITSL